MSRTRTTPQRLKYWDSDDVHYFIIKTFKDTTSLHCHCHYEFFLVTHGEVMHNVNDTCQHLVQGSLVFIRPDDCHFYEPIGEWNCRIINIPLTTAFMKEIMHFLGKDFLNESLLKPPIPPVVVLSKQETTAIDKMFERFDTVTQQNDWYVDAELKALTVKLAIHCTRPFSEKRKDNVPEWLEKLCQQMQHKDNFTKGLEIMVKLAGKTPQHLCFSFRKYLSTTPTDYINVLRLNYARNLLANSDENIANICFEAGFENISHFYHLFKKEFNISPAGFRKGLLQKHS